MERAGIGGGTGRHVRVPPGEKFGEAEIEDFRGAAFHDENVCGLDVAVQDAILVRGIERVGELDADFHCAWNRQGAAFEQTVQRLAVEEFHHNEGVALAFLDRVNGADARMIQGGSRARFPEKSFQRLRGAVRLLGKKLQGDAPAKFGVLRFVDDAHASGAELAEDSVVENRLGVHGERDEGC